MDVNINSNNVAVVITDTLSDKVMGIIAILTGQNGVFTAFDITKRVRQENPTMNVPHEDVKDMVFEEYKNTFCDDYESTLTELTISQHAFVYHPEGVSPLTHPLAVQDDSDTSSPDGTKVLNSTPLTDANRLNISRTFLDRLNLKAGMLVNVTTANGVMSLTNVPVPAGRILVVNSDGRLRIGSRLLSRAFNGLKSEYEIRVSSDTSAITVRPIG